MTDSNEVHQRTVSESRVANDLYDLTEACAATGHDISGGLLGGEFGYGAYVDNDVFMMHPFCWCERPECPWCRGCECPDDATIYQIANRRVTFDEWLNEYDYTGNALRSWRKNPDLTCDYCLGMAPAAPNFLHKASGTAVRWYKYIGRGMELDIQGRWGDIVRECFAAIGADGDA